MTSRRIWIFNFATTASFFSVVAIALLTRIDLSESDKDIILFYLVVVIGLYLAFLTYLFYQRIYRWGLKKRSPYYVTMLLAVVICVIVFLQLVIRSNGDFTGRTIVVLLFCTVNVVSYFLALHKK